MCVGGGGDSGARVSESFLLRIQIENNKKNCFGVGGGGAAVSEFFLL